MFPTAMVTFVTLRGRKESDVSASHDADACYARQIDVPDLCRDVSEGQPD
jgi:hypothetical protein